MPARAAAGAVVGNQPLVPQFAENEPDGLVLDSEALSVLARPHQDLQRHQLVRAALRSAHQRNFPVRVPSAVLVELYRGGGTDATIDSVLARGFAQVETTGARTARVAGHLLAAAGAGSELAIVRLPSRQRSAPVVAWSSHMIPAT